MGRAGIWAAGRWGQDDSRRFGVGIGWRWRAGRCLRQGGSIGGANNFVGRRGHGRRRVDRGFRIRVKMQKSDDPAKEHEEPSYDRPAFCIYDTPVMAFRMGRIRRRQCIVISGSGMLDSETCGMSRRPGRNIRLEEFARINLREAMARGHRGTRYDFWFWLFGRHKKLCTA